MAMTRLGKKGSYAMFGSVARPHPKRGERKGYRTVSPLALREEIRGLRFQCCQAQRRLLQLCLELWIFDMMTRFFPLLHLRGRR